MTFETLTDPGLLYTVRIADASTNGKGAAKPDALIYSRVTEILDVIRR